MRLLQKEWELMEIFFAEEETIKAEILDSKENKVETTVNRKSEMTEASFDTEGFSVFAVVGVEDSFSS